MASRRRLLGRGPRRGERIGTLEHGDLVAGDRLREQRRRNRRQATLSPPGPDVLQEPQVFFEVLVRAPDDEQVARRQRGVGRRPGLEQRGEVLASVDGFLERVDFDCVQGGVAECAGPRQETRQSHGPSDVGGLGAREAGCGALCPASAGGAGGEIDRRGLRRRSGSRGRFMRVCQKGRRPARGKATRARLRPRRNGRFPRRRARGRPAAVPGRPAKRAPPRRPARPPESPRAHTRGRRNTAAGGAVGGSTPPSRCPVRRAPGPAHRDPGTRTTY
jgi:hypothetical protein